MFIDCKTIDVTISPERDIIDLKFGEKQIMPDKIDNPVFVALKTEGVGGFKFYGIYIMTENKDKHIKLEDFNPTYYSDKPNRRAVYDF